jgi:hypothetical protein
MMLLSAVFLYWKVQTHCLKVAVTHTTESASVNRVAEDILLLLACCWVLEDNILYILLVVEFISSSPHLVGEIWECFYLPGALLKMMTSLTTVDPVQ